MALFSNKVKQSQSNLQLQNKIQRYVECYGMETEELFKKLQEEAMENLAIQEDKQHGVSSSKQEKFPNEIKIISQGLAYRKGELADLDEIHTLLTEAYHEETEGEESFRTGPVITKDVINQYLNDPSYHWLVTEAPQGFELEKDGVILGVCCFSTDGISKRNGSIIIFFLSFLS
jgi:hypothetical protein